MRRILSSGFFFSSSARVMAGSVPWRHIQYRSDFLFFIAPDEANHPVPDSGDEKDSASDDDDEIEGAPHQMRAGMWTRSPGCRTRS